MILWPSVSKNSKSSFGWVATTAGSLLEANEENKNENKNDSRSTAKFPESMASPVYILKLICLAIVRLAKRAWLFTQTVVAAVKQRRLKSERNEFEIERLDRIRNPSKYLGK